MPSDPETRPRHLDLTPEQKAQIQDVLARQEGLEADAVDISRLTMDIVECSPIEGDAPRLLTLRIANVSFVVHQGVTTQLN